MDRKTVIEKIEKAKVDTKMTLQDVFDIADKWFKTRSWCKYLKWEQFDTYKLIMFGSPIDDDDDTIWKEETPEKEKQTGTDDINAIANCLVKKV